MELQFFSIRASAPSEDELAALNQLLSSEKVVTVEKQLIDQGENSFWSICVTCSPGTKKKNTGKSGKNRIDYVDVLDEHDFAIFAKLRTLRKTISDKEGVPAYALFTNEHLAEMVRGRVNSKQAMAKLERVGQGRIEKYGDSFLEILNESFPGPATEPISDATKK